MQPTGYGTPDRMSGGGYSSSGRSGQYSSAFQGMGEGRDAMRQSERGRSSRESGFGGGGFHGGGGGFHGGGGHGRR